MSTLSKSTDSVYEKPVPPPANEVASRPWLWSIVALVVAVLALGLACIPALALERPLPNPFAPAPKETPRAEPAPEEERTGGLVLKYKKWSITLGGKKPADNAPAEVAVPAPAAVAPVDEELKLTRDPARWFTMAAVSIGLIGIVVASVGQLREQHTVLTACSMSVCAAAITWQYVAIGIAVGAAAAVLLIILLLFASIFSGA